MKTRPACIRFLLLATAGMAGCAGNPHPVVQLPLVTSPSERAGVTTTADADPFVNAEATRLSLLDRGQDGYLARLALIETAQHSLDMQYYLWWEDITGLALLNRVRAAADRGVKVRILLDDFLYQQPDEHVAILASHPNIEFRLYNPADVSHRSKWVYALDMIVKLRSLDHRMHNKLLIADGQLGVMGGRNIGDDYFGTHEQLNFRDMGVLVDGHALEGAAASFETFWQSEFSRPISYRYEKRVAPGDLAALEQEIAERAKKEAVGGQLELPTSLRFDEARKTIQQYKSRSVLTRTVLVADLPGKAGAFSHGSVILPALLNLQHHAENDVILVTPYYVPYAFEIEDIDNFVESGGRVRILTNSLVSNNQPSVHAGYSARRPKVLRAGAELFEVRGDGRRKMDFTTSPADEESVFGLHCKAAVFDDNRAFLGTFNLDPRSAALNTEIGLLIESKELNQMMRKTFETDLHPANSWSVSHHHSGILQWTGEIEGKLHSTVKEPGTDFWHRLKMRIIRMLPVSREL